jgi:hypothetical protein
MCTSAATKVKRTRPFPFRTARFCAPWHYVPVLAAPACMFRQSLATLVLAIGILGTCHIATAANGPRYLICEVEQWGDVHILIDAFDGVGGAVQHCVHFWQGRPVGTEK